jgi:hypothetical protein
MLLPGTHLRIFAGLGQSFPLAPFAVIPMWTHEREPRETVFTDGRGLIVDPGDLAGLGHVDLTADFANGETWRTVRVELRDLNPGALRSAALLDTRGRVVAAREKPRFLFSAPTLSRFRLRGDASRVGYLARTASTEELLRHPGAMGVLGLPVIGAHPWYFGVHDRNAGMARVEDGAPLRLNPIDQPDGPFDPINPADEVGRVAALLASHELGGGVEAMLSTLVDDGATRPWRSVSKQSLVDRDQVAHVPRLSATQMAALDPGLARFLGFSARLPEIPDLDGDQDWSAIAVVGLLAIDPEFAKAMPHLVPWLTALDPDEPRLVDALVAAIRDQGGVDARSEIDTLIAAARDQGLIVRCMVAVTAPVPPWLPPQLPGPLMTDHNWHASNGMVASDEYRATFLFKQPPLVSLAALAAELNGQWVSRHNDIAGLAPVRKAPRVLGHEVGRGSLDASGLLADERIPADAGTIRYRVHGSDFFGRFGQPTDFQIEPPARPDPPAPVLRYELELDPTDPADLPTTGGVSPGNVRLTFAVPQAVPGHEFDGIDEVTLRTAIVVPGLGALPAGSLPIELATIDVNGDSRDVDVSNPGVYTREFALPDLGPQDTGPVTIKAAFRDSDLRFGAEAQLTFVSRDRRPPVVIDTGVGLFWTSAPGPSPNVQLRLAWKTAANMRSRVYMTDAQGLGLGPADLAEPGTTIPASRGRVAQIGCNKVRGGAPVDKKAFRLLDNDVRADGAGNVIFEANLPRSLETVQFLRIVPLNAEGAEAPFDKCGIVPVAVPDSRRPPLPRLDASVDAATGEVTLTVSTDAFDAVALKRDEPGLFDPAVGEQAAPRFRVKRAAGPVTDPVYGRQVADGELELQAGAAAPPVFEGSGQDTNRNRGLEPFVQYVYWADVQLPPERRLPVGVVPLDVGVTAVDPANGASYPRPVSLPSAPRTVMRVPATPPDAPTAAQVAVNTLRAAGGDVGLEFTITDASVAHSLAIGPYRLAIWTRWPSGSIEPVAQVGGAPFDGTWPAIGSGPIAAMAAAPQPPDTTASPLTLLLGYIDPTGRLGPLLEMVV